MYYLTLEAYVGKTDNLEIRIELKFSRTGASVHKQSTTCHSGQCRVYRLHQDAGISWPRRERLRESPSGASDVVSAGRFQ